MKMALILCIMTLSLLSVAHAAPVDGPYRLSATLVSSYECVPGRGIVPIGTPTVRLTVLAGYPQYDHGLDITPPGAVETYVFESQARWVGDVLAIEGQEPFELGGIEFRESLRGANCAAWPSHRVFGWPLTLEAGGVTVGKIELRETPTLILRKGERTRDVLNGRLGCPTALGGFTENCGP